MACRPRILIGDEPTGNLDTETAGSMFALLRELNESGTTVIYVTHDLGLAALARRLVTVRDGRIVAAAADRQAPSTPTTTTSAVARPDPEGRP
jgi:putative ABC transport system ATP-binding protein